MEILTVLFVLSGNVSDYIHTKVLKQVPVVLKLSKKSINMADKHRQTLMTEMYTHFFSVRHQI